MQFYLSIYIITYAYFSFAYRKNEVAIITYIQAQGKIHHFTRILADLMIY
jgi:hypothetical protein